MGLDKDHTFNNTELACFVTGVAAILMGYSVYSHLKSVQDNHSQTKKLSNKPETKIEDAIQLKSLAYLMQSPNANIQSCASKVILERAMSPSQLTNIISACDKSQPMDIRSKSLSSLQLLTRKEGNKAALLESDALNVLVDALKCTDPEMKEVTQRYVAVAICDLIQGSDINKYKIIGMGILDSIQRILSSQEIRNNELKYWTLMILYQISLSDPLPHILVENGFVKLLAKMARLTYGNTNMPKFCMQSLVRITANVDVTEAKVILVELLDYNILDLISICLRGDDVELIYWAAGLMHEFVIKDVAAEKFRQIRGIHTILSGLLSAEEMYVSRVILRTIKFMAYGQDKFLQEMVRSGMVKKIMHCLSLNDEDIRQWAVLCIHVVAGQVESHQDIVSATEFEVLLELASSSKMKVAIYVSDILSLICCISSNSTYLDPHIKSLLKTLNSLLIEGETDVQYNAAGAIFNIMTTNAPFANKVRQICFKNLLLMSATSTNERVRMICTKGALMVVIKNRYMVFQINSQVTDPLIETVNDLSRLILPVMISQALTGAYKRRSNEVASRPEHLIEENATESDDEDIRVPRASDYIDVTEQGTITNASRLDRVLKNRERAKKKRKQQQQSTNDGLDISYLFGPHLSIQERDAKFQEFKLPPLPRDQLTATLTALNILLENDQVIGSVMTGKHNGSHSALLDMMDDVVAEDPSEASTVYSRLNPTGHRPLTHTPHYAAENMTLPIHIQYVIRHLVHLVIYPTLDAWAESRWSHHSLTSLTETKANSMYQDVLQWIYRFSEFPKRGQEALQRPRFHENRTGSSHIGDTSSEEDEEGPLFSSYTKKKQEDSQQSSQTSKKYHGFSRRALILLQSLTRYASVRHYLIQDLQFLKVLFYLLEADSTPTERVMTCLGTLFAHDPQVRIPKHEFQILAILVWHSVLFSKSRSFYFYSRFVLTYCSRSVTDRATAQMINHASCVEIDLVSRSKFCLIDYASCLHVRNDSWTFETVRATHGVSSLKKDSKGQCYAYEVRLESGGLMQVGWVTDHFEFDPEGGKGVGDDIHSFGYDGSRAKKWHGKYANMRTTTYGMIWHEGDTVTCAIDLEKGEISYYLNGTDMGVAFFNIAGNRSWYPAVSLATGQQCKLQFGGPTDPLKHLPEGYLAISTLASQSLFNMELPPPRMAKQVSLEDSDLSDLSKAMEHMSFKSPVLNDGNTEPSLKPIDSIEPIQDISIRSEQFSFYFMKSSPHEQNTLSSVYYEIALEFYKEDSLNVSSLNESVFKFGLQCLGPQAFICFEYHTVQKYLTFVIGSDRSEAFEFEIADGDRIGLLYVNETNAFGVTLNGQVQFFIYVGKNVSFEPYIPFVSGLMRNNVNYGEEPFAWVFANHPSSKQHRLSYLYSLVGKISEF